MCCRFKRDSKVEVSVSKASKLKRHTGFLVYITDFGSPFAPLIQCAGDDASRKVRLFELPVDNELPPEDPVVCGHMDRQGPER